MSVMAETSQSAIGPCVSVAAVGFASNARTAVCREALVVKVPGGDGGSGGDVGGVGGVGTPPKDSLPWLPPAKEKVCPKPGADHSAPFQPSPYESVMSRVHVAPSATANGTLEVYGAPPLSVVPSEQLRPQPTSLGYDPLEQVIVEDADVDSGDGGGVCELLSTAKTIGTHCGGQETPPTRGRVCRFDGACPTRACESRGALIE